MPSSTVTPCIGKRSAFSLVELVVVVLIVGILAAVAAPRMFNTASEARTNATRAQLTVIRDAIELYRARNGSFPTYSTLAADLKPFLSGPFPRVQITTTNNNANVRELTGTGAFTPSGTEGWAYHATDGNFYVNHADGSTW
jgi:general secretion pathway protein G